MNHNSLHKKEVFFIQDIAIIVLSITIAFILIKTRVISDILLSSQNLELLGSFIAGLFFTSIFTTAPAIVTLGYIAQSNSIVLTAILGSLGAVLGDLIIFHFVKDRLSEHLIELVSHNSLWKRTKSLFRLRYFRWITFLFGGLLIASPLPDEFGIGLLGFSRMKVSQFIPISLFFNFVGILLIGIFANSV